MGIYHYHIPFFFQFERSAVPHGEKKQQLLYFCFNPMAVLS